MASFILTLVLSLAPPPADRSATTAEAPTAVEAWSPAPVEAPAPAAAAPAPTPMPMPMPVSVTPPTPGAPAADGPQPYGAPPPPTADGPAPPPPQRQRTWPDRPIRWRFDIAAELGTTVIRDTAWRAFDSNRSAFTVGATIRGDVRLGSGRVFLGGGASFRRFASDGSIYGTLHTDIAVREPLAFLRLSVVTVEGLDVFAQVGGGPSFARLSTSSYSYNGYDYSSSYAEQKAILGMGDAQAGLSLYLPKKWLPRRGASRVSAGLELAAGYTFRTQLKVRPDLGVDEDPLPTHTSSLGDVAVRGFQWRFGLFLRFQ